MNECGKQEQSRTPNRALRKEHGTEDAKQERRGPEAFYRPFSAGKLVTIFNFQIAQTFHTLRELGFG